MKTTSSNRNLSWWVIMLAMVLGLATTSMAITLPLTGGTNTDPAMVAVPRVDLSLFSTATSLVKAMADIHDRFGTYLFDRAAKLGCEPASLAAIIYVESGGRGFSGSRMIIRFENHVFRPRLNDDTLFNLHFQYDPNVPFQGHTFRAATTGPFAPFHGNQDLEWTVLQFAQGLNDLAALESASYGAPQIIGFNAKSIGYPSAREMFQAFSNSLSAQMDGMIAFIKGRSSCLTGLRTNDFVMFATCYNGNGQAAQYGANILAAHNAYAQVLSTLKITVPSRCQYDGLSGTCGMASCNGQQYPSVDCQSSNSQCCVTDIPCQPSGQAPGLCIDSTRCTNGQVFSGLCPGGTSIKCCVQPTPPPTPPPTRPPSPPACQYQGLNGACSPDCTGANFAYTDSDCTGVGDGKCCVPAQSCSPQPGVTGTCLDTAVCDGTTFSGLCPGSAAIKCCVRTKAPTPNPTPSPTTTCSYEGLSGYCSSTSSCTRQANFMGYADSAECGTGGFCCVPAQSCNNNAGTCVDTSICPTGSTILSGLCPGSAKIKCCMHKFNLENGAIVPDDPNTSPSSSSSDGSTAVVIGVAVPAALLTSMAAAFIVLRRRRAKRELEGDQRWSVVVHRDGNGNRMTNMAGDNPAFVHNSNNLHV